MTTGLIIIIIIITVFIQRLTHRRLVYNGITGMRGAGVHGASRLPTARSSLQAAYSQHRPCGALVITSWSQLCCLVGRGTCVWTTYPRLLRGMPRSGIELATFRSRVASANHWATAPHDCSRVTALTHTHTQRKRERENIENNANYTLRCRAVEWYCGSLTELLLDIGLNKKISRLYFHLNCLCLINKF